jgi:hypothetical protein
MTDPKITAKWTVGDREYEAPAINPGDWFGKTWHLSVCVCNTGGPHFIVEADHLGDAIDILAEDEQYGGCIAIDVEIDGDDYGEPLSNGIELTEEQEAKADEAAKRLGVPRDDLWITLKGNFVEGGCIAEPHMSGQGVWYDADNLSIDGQEGIANGRGMPFPVTYHAPGFLPEGISPLDYDHWDWDEETRLFREICPDCNTRLEDGVCPECSDDV